MAINLEEHRIFLRPANPPAQMKKIVPFFIFVLSFSSQAQISQRKLLKGKVNAHTTNLEGIFVINKTSEKESATKEGGYFTIMAMPGDSLMFASIEFKGKTVAVDSTHFGQEMLTVKLETMVNQLDEVMVIQYKDINAYSLGILTTKAKSYTPAERKLHTATGVDPKIGLNSSFGVDPLLNLFSGRTSMLKKELEVEKKENWIDKLEDIYDEEYLTVKLKIPAAYLKGFLYYIVENEHFVNSLRAKDKTMNQFLIVQLAEKYLKTLEDEK